MNILYFLAGMILLAFALAMPVPQRPEVITSIPYCYSMQHDVYLPCMYSSKEYRA